MANPWFFICCPTCHLLWLEEGSVGPGQKLDALCPHCKHPVTITFGISSGGILIVTGVLDSITGRRGDWARVLDNRFHWREVN